MPVHTSSPSSVQVNKWRCSPFTERPLSAVKQLVSKVGRSDAPTHTIEETPCKSECQIVVQDFNEPADKKKKTWSQRDFPSPASKGDLKGISQSWWEWYEIHKCALCTYIRICMYRSLASTQAEHPKSSIETWWIYNVHTLNNILCAKEVFANFRFIWWLSENCGTPQHQPLDTLQAMRIIYSLSCFLGISSCSESLWIHRANYNNSPTWIQFPM